MATAEGVVVLIAVVFKDVGFILALTGAVGASFLGYILPSIIYFRCYEDDFNIICSETSALYKGALGIPLNSNTRNSSNSADFNVELANATEAERVRSESASGRDPPSCGQRVWTLIQCGLAFKQFYFCFFCGILGVFLLVCGVYTVFYDFYHGD